MTIPPLGRQHPSFNPLSRVAQCLMADWLYAPPIFPTEGTPAPASVPIDPIQRPQLQTPATLKALAFVDLETTGLNPTCHDILEVAVLRVDARTLKLLGQYSVLVAPERLEQARPDALEVCGFTKAAWANAVPLKAALEAISPLLEGALVAGHNVGFDWGFLEAGFRRAGLPLPRVDHHRLDTASLAWPLFVDGEVPSLSLDALASHFGLSRRWPHRALSDALCALEVARRLAARMRRGGRRLPEALLGLAEDGGGTRPRGESRDEVMDGLYGLAAKPAKQRRRRRVYICHPFADSPQENTARVRDISRALIDEGVFPVAPHLYLPQLLDESTERERALALCVELLDTCDELRVFGGRVTAGMKRELEHALVHGLPVRFEREVAQ